MFLILLACGTPEPEHQVEPLLPNGVFLPTAAGESTLSPKSTPYTGLMTIRGGAVDQTIGYGHSKRTLEESARHERDLVLSALGLPVGGELVTVPIEVAGTPGVQWSVDGGTTHFIGASFDLCAHRIAVVSYGSSSSEVTAAHAASLAGAVCAKRPPVPAP